MKSLRSLIAVCMILMLIPGASVTALAADDSITSVRITVNETKEAAGTVWEAEPSVSSRDYEITDYDWSSDYGKWTPGSKVTLTVVLESEEKSFDKNVSVRITNGESANVKRDNAHKLTVKINYIPKIILEMPGDAWYEDEYVLKWDKVDNAGGYEVRLYRNGSNSYFKTISLDGRNNTSVDISQYVTDEDEVTAAIRAVPSSSKSSYITASDWYHFDDEYVTGSDYSSVYGNFSGSGSNMRFKDSYTDEYVSGWQLINGSWYYFDPAQGDRAVTDSWADIDGDWYAFDADGRMITGWYKSGDFWYYLSGSGSMASGWIQTGPNTPWYYLSPVRTGKYPAGAMYFNDITPDGYFVNENGEWQI